MAHSFESTFLKFKEPLHKGYRFFRAKNYSPCWHNSEKYLGNKEWLHCDFYWNPRVLGLSKAVAFIHSSFSVIKNIHIQYAVHGFAIHTWDAATPTTQSTFSEVYFAWGGFACELGLASYTDKVVKNRGLDSLAGFNMPANFMVFMFDFSQECFCIKHQTALTVSSQFVPHLPVLILLPCHVLSLYKWTHAFCLLRLLITPPTPHLSFCSHYINTPSLVLLHLCWSTVTLSCVCDPSFAFDVHQSSCFHYLLVGVSNNVCAAVFASLLVPCYPENFTTADVLYFRRHTEVLCGASGAAAQW